MTLLICVTLWVTGLGHGPAWCGPEAPVRVCRGRFLWDLYQGVAQATWIPCRSETPDQDAAQLAAQVEALRESDD